MASTVLWRFILGGDAGGGQGAVAPFSAESFRAKRREAMGLSTINRRNRLSAFTGAYTGELSVLVFWYEFIIFLMLTVSALGTKERVCWVEH